MSNSSLGTSRRDSRGKPTTRPTLWMRWMRWPQSSSYRWPKILEWLPNRSKRAVRPPPRSGNVALQRRNAPHGATKSAARGYFNALHVHHGSAAIYLLEAPALAEDVRL